MTRTEIARLAAAQNKQLADYRNGKGRVPAIGERPMYVRMTPAEFHALQDNPGQRDTVRRAPKAHYLRTFKVVHADMQAGQLPSGRMIKINGHTRALIHTSQGQPDIPKVDFVPPYYNVRVYQIHDEQTAVDLYECVDTTDETKDANDRLASVEKLLGLSWTTPYLVKRKYTSAVRYADAILHEDCEPSKARGFKGPTLLRIVEQMQGTLRLVDEMVVPASHVPTPVVTALMVARVWQGDAARSFFASYLAKEGTQVGNKVSTEFAYRDALGALSRKNIDVQVDEAVRFAISAVDRFRNSNRPMLPCLKKASDERIEELREQAIEAHQ